MELLLFLVGALLVAVLAHTKVGLGWSRAVLVGLCFLPLFIFGLVLISGYLGDDSVSDGAAILATIAVWALCIGIALAIASHFRHHPGAPAHR